MTFQLTFLLSTLLLLSAAVHAQASRPPDFVLFLADDQTWSDCGCYGNADVRTPNIDALAAAGMRFDRMFTTTAMCAPTRQQLYTGLFPVRSGAYPNHSMVKPGTKSLVHRLRGLGYRVALAGKRHVGPRDSFPFERLGGKGQEKVLGLPEQAIAEFIGRDREQPFCLVVASNEPHQPWNRGDASSYPPDELTIPPHLFDTAATREALAKYYAEIEYLDRQVGRCLAVLREHGDPEHTAFVFTSEQGSQLPFGKWTCYDLGLKTAFIVRWPARVPAGSVTTAMTQYVDVLPTMIAAAGGEPAPLDGRSFLGVLDGDAHEHRDVVFGVHTTRGIIEGSDCYPIRSIRTERYKLILNLNAEREPFSNLLAGDDRSSPVLASWLEAGGEAAERARAYRVRPPVEFYDLESDPLEQRNLADREEHAERIADLDRRLRAWMREQGDDGVETEMLATPRRRR